QRIAQHQANAAVFLVGQNRGAAEGVAQGLTIRQDNLVTAARQYPFVIGEFAVDQFRGEGEITRGRANVVGAEDNIDQVIRFAQQPWQFQNALAWHDQLVLFL